MDEVTKIILYGFINIFLAALSGASGIGSGIVSVPILIALGLNPASAIATSKFSAFGQAVGSSTRYYREKLVTKRQFLIFGALSLFAGLVGSLGLVAIQNQHELIENLVGLIILMVGVPFLYLKKRGFELKGNPRYLRAIGFALVFIVVMLVSGIGSGIGTLQAIVFMSFFGMKALNAIALQRSMLLVSTLVVLAVFIANGLIDYRYGVAGILSATTGSFIGAHIAVKKGDKFVLNLLAVVSAVLALYLLFN